MKTRNVDSCPTLDVKEKSSKENDSIRSRGVGRVHVLVERRKQEVSNREILFQ